MTAKSNQRSGDGEYRVEALDCAQGDDVERGFWQRLGTGVLYIDIRQCKGAGEFAEERCFLVVRFDQRDVDVRHPQFDGDTGEARTGAYVGERDFLSLLRSWVE